MPLAQPKVDELFAGQQLTPSQRAERYDEYMAKLATPKVAKLDRGFPHMQGDGAHGLDFSEAGALAGSRSPLSILQASMATPELTKALSPSDLASVVSALDAMKAQIPDLTKDITTSSPVSAGLVAFDLEAPAKMLTPRPTPLRNMIPRDRGVGLSHLYKRITGFSGTGTGGVGVARPGIVDTTQTDFKMSGASNSIFWGRGQKISYAGDTITVPYVQFSLSDEVNWSAQFAGQGYQDVRALSRNALLWASMLAEERILLNGRGTGSGYAGILAAPTAGTNTDRAAVTGETGITNASANLYVRIVAEMGDLGVSQATAASGAVAFTQGHVVDVTYTLPAGATGARVFISSAAGADPGDAARFLYTFTGGGVYGGRSGYNKITIQGTLPASGTVPTAWPLTAGGTANLTAADGGSAVAAEYDGIHAYANGSTTGYRAALNTTFSTSNPGIEYQRAFASLFDSVKAEPDRIIMAAADRVQLSDAIKGSSNSNYQIKLTQDDVSGYTLGSVATAILNESIGKICDLMVHPWYKQGNSIVMSDNLPIPDSNVPSVFRVFNVQDMMGVDWPVNQFAYEASSYWFGTAVCYAPAWLGSVCGIQAV